MFSLAKHIKRVVNVFLLVFCLSSISFSFVEALRQAQARGKILILLLLRALGLMAASRLFHSELAIIE